MSILRENFAPSGASTSKRHELASTNIIDLAEGCSQLSELLKVQLLSGMDQISLRKEINVTGLEMKTVAEKTAEQVKQKKILLFNFEFIFILFHIFSAIDESKFVNVRKTRCCMQCRDGCSSCIRRTNISS